MGAQGSDPGAKEAPVCDPAASTAAGPDDEAPQQAHAEAQGTETQSEGQDSHGEERHAGAQKDPEDTKDTQGGGQEGQKEDYGGDCPNQRGDEPHQAKDVFAAGTTGKPATGGEPQAQPAGSETPAGKGKETSPMQRQLRAPRGEERPFDFNRFLEQMRHRSAVPVNEYVKSFLKGFSKRPYRTADQVKLVYDFLAFISDRMAEADVWARLPPAEFEQATEAMEKLIMNRLYVYTFSPAVAHEGRWTVQNDDLDRDEVLSQRITLLSWVNEDHLDVPRGAHSDRFFAFAAQELQKINHYKAPRDKVICIMNCCKVIFGLIRHLGKEENADAFVPLLILVVLRANPAHLISNLEYITRFRNPERASSEVDYYLSTLAGAVTFIESMDHTSLSHVDQVQFEANIEAALRANAPPTQTLEGPPEAPLHTQLAAMNLADDTRAFLQRTSEAARAGFTSSVSKPVSALSRLFIERIDDALSPSGEPRARELQTPAPSAAAPPAPGVAPNAPLRQRQAAEEQTPEASEDPAAQARGGARRAPSWRGGLMPRFLADAERDEAEEDEEEEPSSPSRLVAAAREVRADTSTDSVLADESAQLASGTHTLQSIFPQMEEGVLQLVLQECRGNVEAAIDRLLEMT